MMDDGKESIRIMNIFHVALFEWLSNTYEDLLCTATQRCPHSEVDKIMISFGIAASTMIKKIEQRKRHDTLDLPNDLVISACYHPNVNNSAQKFIRDQLQLNSFRIFRMETLERPDQVLLPILHEMSNRQVRLLLIFIILLVSVIITSFFLRLRGIKAL
ncbi:hypothetical protein BD408DRAFT_160139 [Parasitella parasitica]|nr:hypothetical protein BD408DRAFT_160139 [Parasitella parasitica]